ncbi:SDR family oxidoreductase [Bacillus sp. ISL-4]|nr:SDR family oxidoreductase [Bacillus sp. ISL-4]MBT2669310.1 SDR family oxidoreductase [Streptomyces sp. ISL-14]
MGKRETAEEVAKAILYLASDKVSFLIGAVLLIDGGVTARLK